MDAAVPACFAKSDGHGALKSFGVTANEVTRVGRASDAEEEGRAHVDEDDAPENLTNSLRNSNTRVSGLSCGDSNGLYTGIEGGAEDEDGGDAAEVVTVERTWVVPVTEAKGFILADEATGGVNDGEDEVGGKTEKFCKGEPELCLAEGFDTEHLESEEYSPEAV